MCSVHRERGEIRFVGLHAGVHLVIEDVLVFCPDSQFFVWVFWELLLPGKTHDVSKSMMASSRNGRTTAWMTQGSSAVPLPSGKWFGAEIGDQNSSCAVDRHGLAPERRDVGHIRSTLFRV